MQLSQRRRTLQRTGSTAKASKCFGAWVISGPEPPKETELCTLLYNLNPRKLVLSLRTRSLFRFHIGVRLGRKPLWENFVCFLQCSMISDCPPGHASEVSKERFLEENDFSCSWPLSRQVRTTVSTARYRYWDETACMAFSLLPFELVGRRIFPTTVYVDLCRPLPFPSSLLHSL